MESVSQLRDPPMLLGTLGSSSGAPGADGGEAMTRIPFVANGMLQMAAAREAAGVVVGSPAWFAWLADDSARSFTFRSPAGDYTARKERRQRGGAYWVAYRTAAGRQYKKYLGTAPDLTPEQLSDAAGALAARIADAAATASDSAAGPKNRRAVWPENAAGLLLATKLFVPRPRPDLVPRPRLLARLDEGLDDGGCSLLSAPAGTGKTSLLAAWAARLDRPVAWLALDERDQEVHQVLRYLVASLQTIAPECGRTALALLDAPPTAPPEMVLTSLLNDLAALPAPRSWCWTTTTWCERRPSMPRLSFSSTTCHGPCTWRSSPERTRRFRCPACAPEAR